jgi:hypothetical protein
MLADERFDLVFTSLVLQHLPSRRSIARHARDLAKLVASGGVLIAQVPDRMAWRARIQARPKIYAALRLPGIPPAALYRHLHVEPITMRTFPRASFEWLLEMEGLRLVSVTERWRGTVRFCTYQAVRPS